MFIGSEDSVATVAARDILYRDGIVLIINNTTNLPIVRDDRFQYWRLPLESIETRMATFRQEVLGRVAHGGRVLFHCRAGVDRFELCRIVQT